MPRVLVLVPGHSGSLDLFHELQLRSLPFTLTFAALWYSFAAGTESAHLC
jgi:hypothetical protein